MNNANIISQIAMNEIHVSLNTVDYNSRLATSGMC